MAKNPEDITAGDIIRVLEGPLAPVDCVSELNPDQCERADICVTENYGARYGIQSLRSSIPIPCPTWPASPEHATWRAFHQ